MSKSTVSIDEISEFSTVVANSTHKASEVDEEIVIVDLEVQEFYGLNPVGATIWKLIQQPRTVLEIQQQISTEHQISIQDCQQDIVNFLSELAAAKLITIEH